MWWARESSEKSHRGPFQSLLFCDTCILLEPHELNPTVLLHLYGTSCNSTELKPPENQGFIRLMFCLAYAVPQIAHFWISPSSSVLSISVKDCVALYTEKLYFCQGVINEENRFYLSSLSVFPQCSVQVFPSYLWSVITYHHFLW